MENEKRCKYFGMEGYQCSHNGRVLAKDLCDRHYYQIHRFGEVRPYKKNPKCVVYKTPGFTCSRKSGGAVYADKMCVKHFKQYYKHGKLFADQEISDNGGKCKKRK